MKLKKGDQVKVARGKDKGKIAKIEKVFPKIGKVLLLGLNQYKRHLKSQNQSRPSEIVTITKPLSVSSVAFLCPKCKKTSRLGFMGVSNEKFRICGKCKEKI